MYINDPKSLDSDVGEVGKSKSLNRTILTPFVASSCAILIFSVYALASFGSNSYEPGIAVKEV